MPPTRAGIRRLIVRFLGRRVALGVASGAVRREPPSREYDVEGTASDYDDRPGELPR
jgi:hypothetical protein